MVEEAKVEAGLSDLEEEDDGIRKKIVKKHAR